MFSKMPVPRGLSGKFGAVRNKLTKDVKSSLLVGFLCLIQLAKVVDEEFEYGVLNLRNGT